jgi:hypothetical protein
VEPVLGLIVLIAVIWAVVAGWNAMVRNISGPSDEQLIDEHERRNAQTLGAGAYLYSSGGYAGGDSSLAGGTTGSGGGGVSGGSGDSGGSGGDGGGGGGSW